MSVISNENSNILLTEWLEKKGLINQNVINLVKSMGRIPLYTDKGIPKLLSEEYIMFNKGFVTEDDIFEYYTETRPYKYKGKLNKKLLPILEIIEQSFSDNNLKIALDPTTQEEIVKKRDLSAVLVKLNPSEVKRLSKEDENYRQIFKEMEISSVEDLYFILTNQPYNTKLHKTLTIASGVKKTELPVYMLDTKTYLYFLTKPKNTLREINKLTNQLNDSKMPEEMMAKGYFKRWFNLILRYSLEIGASDIHIEPDELFYTIRIRKDGILQFLCAIKKEYNILSLVLANTDQNDQEGMKPLDGQLDFYHPILEITNVRWAENKTVYGSHIVMRLLPSGINAMLLDQINYSKRNLNIIKHKLLKEPNGIILITGPTGSGKTNTLSAILRYISKLETKILSVEDPVEIKMPLIQQIQVNNKANLTVHAALKSFLRQDPDIMFIGEIRDQEMATKAVEGAMTGHLMFATLHTNDSVSAIMRLEDIGVGPMHLANTLRGVIAQRLLRKLCPYCKVRVSESEIENSKFYKDFGIEDNGSIFKHNEKGCEKCGYTGYSGRIPVAEIFVIDKKVQDLILERKSINEILEEIKENGFRTLQMEGLKLVEEGITDIEEVVRVLGGSEKELEFNYDLYEEELE